MSHLKLPNEFQLQPQTSSVPYDIRAYESLGARRTRIHTNIFVDSFAMHTFSAFV